MSLAKECLRIARLAPHGSPVIDVVNLFLSSDEIVPTNRDLAQKLRDLKRKNPHLVHQHIKTELRQVVYEHERETFWLKRQRVG